MFNSQSVDLDIFNHNMAVAINFVTGKVKFQSTVMIVADISFIHFYSVI